MRKKKIRQYLSAMDVVPWIRREDQSEVKSYQSIKEAKKSTAADVLFQLAETVAACRDCTLQQTRRQTVFGSGSVLADWLFVGEAPGAEEDRRGIPFVGRAGQLLEAMMVALDLDRSQTYIANVLKCRPPDNRDPLGVEVRSCEKYLHRQIQALQPRIIIALGKFAAQSLLKSPLPIGKLRGRVHLYQPFDVPLIATYHPAYLLRSPLEKRKVWSDLLLAKTVVDPTIE